MADSSLQDIICCIGHPVSANPTQYVLECATAASTLDCRCLTLDVAPDQLEHSVAGMRAMGFCGAIVALPHETQVGQYLDATRGVAAEHKYVDLIYRENGSLVGEATIGVAILNLVRQLKKSAAHQATESVTDERVDHADKMPKTALVWGDEPRAMAIAAELAAAGLRTTVATTDASVGDAAADEAAKNEPAAGPGAGATTVDAGTETDFAGADEAGLATTRPETATATQTATEQQHAAEQQLSAAAAAKAPQPGEPAGAIRYLTWEGLTIGKVGAELVVQACPSPGDLRFALPRPELPTVAVDLTTEPIRTDFLRAAEAAGCDIIDSVAVQLQMLIIAFQRWTGVQPDEQIMRDALEEFLSV